MLKVVLVALSVTGLALPVAAIPDLLTWYTLELFVVDYLHIFLPLWLKAPLLIAVGVLPARWLGRLALQVYRVERAFSEGRDPNLP